MEQSKIIDTLETYQVPSHLSFQDAPHQALVGSSRVRQAEGHANVTVRWTLATSHARKPDALLQHDSIEPWVVDADTQPTILAEMWGYIG